MNAKKLVDLWLSYARENSIAAGKQEGRPAEDTDLIKFLSGHGFEESQITKIIDALPDATPSVPDAEINRSIRTGTRYTASDGNLYVWAGQRWLNDNTLKPATKEISDELNAKETEKQSKAAASAEPGAEETGPEVSDTEPTTGTGAEVRPELRKDSTTDSEVDPDTSGDKEAETQSNQEQPDGEEKASSEITPKQAEYLNRIKKVVKTLNKEQLRQLKRELQ